jgi:preprotein translocase subunit SecE
VARPSRTRRRGKRSADFQAPAAAADRARTRRREIKPVGQPKSQTGAQRERRGGFRAFAGESAAELKKVEWPGRRQLFSATVVVIIAVAVVGAYLWVADLALSRFVRDILLNL